MSKFDNGMFKTWQHILNVDEKSLEDEDSNEFFIRDNERRKIANRLLKLGVKKDIIFEATGIKIK